MFRYPILTTVLLPVVILYFGLSLTVHETIYLSEGELRSAEGSKEVHLKSKLEGAYAKRGLHIPPESSLNVSFKEPLSVVRIALQANGKTRYTVHSNKETLMVGEPTHARGLRTRFSERFNPPKELTGFTIDPEKNLLRDSIGEVSVYTEKARYNLLPLSLLLLLLTPFLYYLKPSNSLLSFLRRYDAPIFILLTGCIVHTLWIPAILAVLIILSFQILKPKEETKEEDSRANTLWFALTLFIILITQSYFLTGGSWFFDVPEHLNDTFDSLGSRLLNGEVDVRPFSIDNEGFKRGEQYFTYFGPVPAFLRIALNTLDPLSYGKWARLSCIIASASTLLPLLLLLSLQISRLNLSGNGRRALTSILLFAFTLGTPMFFVTSYGYIFHEAQLWGLAMSTWAIYYLFLWLKKREGRHLALLSTFTALALLSRVSYGVALYFTLALVTLNGMYHEIITEKKKQIGDIIVRYTLLLSPAILGLSFQGWYNFKRFESPFSFINFDYYLLRGGNLPKVLESGTFNLERILTTFPHYFGWSSTYFTERAPFFQVARPTYLAPELMIKYKEWSISLLVASPWLLLGALIGAIYLLVSSNKWLHRLIVITLGTQTVLLLSYICVTQRYSTDFLPLLTYLFLFTIIAIENRPKLTKSVIPLTLIFTLPSIIITILSTMSWQTNLNSWGTTKRYLSELQGFYRVLDSSIGTLL